MRSLCFLLAGSAALLAAGCASTANFKENFGEPVKKIIAKPEAPEGAFTLSEEFDLSARGEGEVNTVKVYKSEAERFTPKDGFCFITGLHGNGGPGNYAQITHDAEGWYMRVRSLGPIVNMSARCAYIH